MATAVVILGAGLAGLAAATAMAQRGLAVTLCEARHRFGGRASSFTDAASGQVLDLCQHVSMGCCTNFAHFARTVGVAHLLRPQPELFFITPDRRVSRFRADPLPAPLHLARSFLSAHYLRLDEKLRIAWALSRLQIADAENDEPFRDWLRRHRQTPRIIARFWSVVLTSALNETPERIGLRYARKVFVDGFLRHSRGFEVSLPRVPLARLYGAELSRWLEQQGVRVLLGTAVRRLIVAEQQVSRVELRDGSALTADYYVSTVPFDRLLDLLPVALIDTEPYFGNLRRLEASPITSVHLWYDRPITRLPHVVFIDCLSQWLFVRGETAPGEYYVQVVVSAARSFRGVERDEVMRLIIAELAGLFPAARDAKLLRTRMVTEQAATFSAVPGVDRWRPAQTSPLRNLFVAGDWTATGWPATMEGAVRSGYLAAEALLQRRGSPEQIVQPDLR